MNEKREIKTAGLDEKYSSEYVKEVIERILRSELADDVGELRKDIIANSEVAVFRIGDRIIEELKEYFEYRLGK